VTRSSSPVCREPALRRAAPGGYAPAAGGEFSATLAAAAQSTQPEREQADYEAWEAPAEDATRIIATAERFLEAIGDLIA